MKSNMVFFEFARKLNIDKNKLNEYNIKDERIYTPYIIDTFNYIKKRLNANPENHNLVDEFSKKSKKTWAFLRAGTTILMLARLLTMHSGRTASKVRAECTNPCFSEKMLWLLLAEQMETEVENLDKEMLVKNIVLPFTGNDKHSWLTFVCWGDRMFGTHLADNPDEVIKMPVKKLFEHWAK